MRRRAIEALTYAGLKKPEPDIVALMQAMLKDDSEPQSIRFSAAAALGRMSLQPPVNIDAAATAKELGYLALIGVESELTRAENLRKTDMEREARLTGTYSPDLSYSGEGGGMPGMPGPGGVRGYGGGYGGERELRPTLRPGTMPGGETDWLNAVDAFFAETSPHKRRG